MDPYLSPFCKASFTFFQQQEVAISNNVKALTSLGSLYKKGLGVRQDITKAVAYFQKAADLGDATAFTELGLIHETKKNIAGALECYQRAAELGNALAFCCLARICLRYDKDVEKNIAKPLGYYQRAGELGETLGFLILGNISLHGEYGVEKNLAKAIKYYQLAGYNGTFSYEEHIKANLLHEQLLQFFRQLLQSSGNQTVNQKYTKWLQTFLTKVTQFRNTVLNKEGDNGELVRFLQEPIPGVGFFNRFWRYKKELVDFTYRLICWNEQQIADLQQVVSPLSVQSSSITAASCSSTLAATKAYLEMQEIPREEISVRRPARVVEMQEIPREIRRPAPPVVEMQEIESFFPSTAAETWDDDLDEEKASRQPLLTVERR